MAIQIVTVDDPLELHLQYPSQGAPQPCYVELDCDAARLRCIVSGEIGSGVPERVWHNRVRRWRIVPLKADAANQLLVDLAPLCERIVAGYRCAWDGSNHVGEFTDDAEAAVDAVSWEIDKCEPWSERQRVSVWDARDWFGGLGGSGAQRRELGIDATTTDDELVAIVAREETRAAAEGVDVLEDCEDHLRGLRDDARADLLDAAARASRYEEDDDLRAAMLLWLAWWGDADAAAIAGAYDASVAAGEVYTAV